MTIANRTNLRTPTCIAATATYASKGKATTMITNATNGANLLTPVDVSDSSFNRVQSVNSETNSEKSGYVPPS
jgi:hypothetical protein